MSILRSFPARALSWSLAAFPAFWNVRAPQEGVQEPRAEPLDAFHPARDVAVEPAWGGSVDVHLSVMPKSVNHMIETSSFTRWMQYEMHETLVNLDWEHWDIRPRLVESWDTEDTLILRGGREPGNTNIVYGALQDEGDDWLVTPVSPAHALQEPVRVPKADVESVERATVFTFHLRHDVKWHDGHPFDAHDVWFTWSCYQNSGVDCDNNRGKFEKALQAEVIDPWTIRFFYAEQYYGVLSSFADFCILPAHLYDLRDPEHPRHDPDATPEEQAKEVNENPHNTDWIGLGPYRMTSWGPRGIEAERFDDYFDPEHGGYLDKIRWRYLQDDSQVITALINGELDFTMRISSEDYFGPATQSEEFQERFYKGYYYVGGFNYVAWNMRRPLFADVRVRKALAHAIDLDEYRRTVANGLAELPTGPMFLHGPAYDRTVERLAYDPAKAEELLSEAGWYDRDGDGIIDKDGLPFEFEYLIPSANSAGRDFSQRLQESLERLGIRMNIVALEWAAFLERVRDREFDGASMAFTVGVPEDDPENLWHSSGAASGVRGSNYPGVADAEVDRLIAQGQRELDDEKRWAIWRQLHRYLYEEVQPYLYYLAPPRKFAMSQRIRGFQAFQVNPGYSIRRWFLPAGTPGTRATRERE